MERELGMDPVEEDDAESARIKKNQTAEFEADRLENEAFEHKRTLPPQRLLDASRDHIAYLTKRIEQLKIAANAKQTHGGFLTKGSIFHMRIPPKFLKNSLYMPPVEPFFPCCLFNDPGHLIGKPEFGQLIQYLEYCVSVFSLQYPRRRDQGRLCFGCAYNCRRIVSWLVENLPVRRSWYQKLPSDATLCELGFNFRSEPRQLIVPDFPYIPPSATFVSMHDQFWWNSECPMVQQIRARSAHGWWDSPLMMGKTFSFFSKVDMNIWGDTEYHLMQQRTVDETVVSYIGSRLSPYTNEQELEALKRLTSAPDHSWFHAHILDKLLHNKQNETESSAQTSTITPQETGVSPKTRKEKRKAYIKAVKKN